MATIGLVAVLIVIAVLLEFMLRRSNTNSGEYHAHTPMIVCQFHSTPGFSAGPLNQYGATQFAKVGARILQI